MPTATSACSTAATSRTATPHAQPDHHGQNVPDVQFWMPSREAEVVRAFADQIPANLTVRLSGAMGDRPPSGGGTERAGNSRDHFFAPPADAMLLRAPVLNTALSSCH